MSSLRLIGISIALLICSCSFAATINVPADYTSIQAAIDAAATGDVIIVAPGIYTESLMIDQKQIVLRSTDPSSKAVVASTIIKSSGGGVVAFYEGTTRQTVLSGFKITGGVAYAPGGGIYCVGASPTITRCLISGNKSTVGGCGIYFGNGAPAITNNTIIGNIPTLNTSTCGGGIYGVITEGEYAPLIANNVIRNNTAKHGGGVYLEGGAPILKNNTISGNQSTAMGNGGGVNWDDAKGIISGNVIEGNSSQQSGGGIFYGDTKAPLITGNIIRNNSALLCGGGLYSIASGVVSNNIISGNAATTTSSGYGTGGGIWCQAPLTKLFNNTFYANVANGYGTGGAVFVNSGCGAVLRNNIIAYHSVGGAFWGAISSTATIVYNDFYSNSSGNVLTRTNINRNPLFANAALGDFHVKSKGGRWNPATSSWVTDAVHSYCIDAGTPNYAYSLEPSPNGGRVNLGAYGNTAQASKAAPVTPASLAMSAAAASTAGGLVQISVNLTADATVQARVLNLAGREVAVLPEAQLSEGTNTLLWSGRSAQGTKAPAGRYLISLTARTADGAQSHCLALLSR
ncbi:MAG: FlgD immunoglobulin-like domain containing protein [Armatimonadota bacterium]